MSSNSFAWLSFNLFVWLIALLCLFVFPITVLVWSDPVGWNWPKYLIRLQSTDWLAANLNYLQIVQNLVSKNHLKDIRLLSKFHLLFFRDIFTTFCLIPFWRRLSHSQFLQNWNVAKIIQKICKNCRFALNKYKAMKRSVSWRDIFWLSEKLDDHVRSKDWVNDSGCQKKLTQ